MQNVSRLGIALGFSYKCREFMKAELEKELFKRHGHKNIRVADNHVKAAGGDGITVTYALRPLAEHNTANYCAGEMIDRVCRYSLLIILAPLCLSRHKRSVKRMVQVLAHACAYAHNNAHNNAHTQMNCVGCMARVRSAQRVRRAVAIGILFILVNHADIGGTNDT